jgi:hypothetical protein
LPDKAFVEYPTGELIQLLIFNGFQLADANPGSVGNLLKWNPLRLSRLSQLIAKGSHCDGNRRPLECLTDGFYHTGDEPNGEPGNIVVSMRPESYNGSAR